MEPWSSANQKQSIKKGFTYNRISLTVHIITLCELGFIIQKRK